MTQFLRMENLTVAVSQIECVQLSDKTIIFRMQSGNVYNAHYPSAVMASDTYDRAMKMLLGQEKP